MEEPVEKDIYRVGTVVLILRMLKLSSGDVRLFVQGILRARVKELDLEGANPWRRSSLSAMWNPRRRPWSSRP